MIYLGVDPGKAGGLVRLPPVEVRPSITSMPSTEKDTLEWFIDASLNDCVAVIEAVHSMPGQGIASTFKFGQNYGFLRACLIAAGIPFKAVTPAKWKGHFGLRRKKDESLTQFKNRSKALAQERFPGIKITHATSEALLLALYAKETW